MRFAPSCITFGIKKPPRVIRGRMGSFMGMSGLPAHARVSYHYENEVHGPRAPLRARDTRRGRRGRQQYLSPIMSRGRAGLEFCFGRAALTEAGAAPPPGDRPATDAGHLIAFSVCERGRAQKWPIPPRRRSRGGIGAGRCPGYRGRSNFLAGGCAGTWYPCRVKSNLLPKY